MTQNNIDKSDMKGVIAQSPEQLKKGLDLAKDIKIEGNFKNVIVCGIGGSALPVNILNSLASPNAPIYTHRDYGLPSIASKDSLIICISYSGNTEETISAMQEAIDKGMKIITIATGGKLEEMSKQESIPLAKIPAGIQPRSATGYLFSTLAEILKNCGIVSDMTDAILKTAQNISDINGDMEKQGKDLAEKLAGKTPIIYSSNNLKALARIWKIKFNENSKIAAFHNYFPELNHNEMVGFTDEKKNKNFTVLIIKDKEDHPRITKRMELTAELLEKRGVKVETISTLEGTLMFRVFASLLLGDWASYYLALNNKVDPTPVVMVEEFKARMKD